MKAERGRARWKKFGIVLIIFFMLICIGFSAFYFMGESAYDSVAATLSHVPGLALLFPDAEKRALQERIQFLEKRLQSAEQMLEEQENVLIMMEEQLIESEEQVRELAADKIQLEAELEGRRLFEEEQDEKLKALANVYRGMSATRAASILENLSLADAALILERMGEQEQAKILGRMTPAFAADLTLVLRESDLVKSPDAAALEEQVSRLLESAEQPASSLSLNHLADTIEKMSPAQAAQLFTAMEEEANQFALAVRIMANLGDDSRSRILDNMDPEVSSAYIRALIE